VGRHAKVEVGIPTINGGRVGRKGREKSEGQRLKEHERRGGSGTEEGPMNP